MRSREGDQCAWGCWWGNGSILALASVLYQVGKGGGQGERAEVCTQGSCGTSEVTCAFH